MFFLLSFSIFRFRSPSISTASPYLHPSVLIPYSSGCTRGCIAWLNPSSAAASYILRDNRDVPCSGSPPPKYSSPSKLITPLIRLFARATITPLAFFRLRSTASPPWSNIFPDGQTDVTQAFNPLVPPEAARIHEIGIFRYRLSVDPAFIVYRWRVAYIVKH